MANDPLYGIRPKWRVFKAIEYMYAHRGTPPGYGELVAIVKGRVDYYPKYLEELKQEGYVTYKTKRVVDYSSIRLTGKRPEDSDYED